MRRVEVVDLLQLDEQQSRAARAAQYGVTEDVIRQWDAEDAVADDDIGLDNEDAVAYRTWRRSAGYSQVPPPFDPQAPS